jgi:hypothetical protein
MRTFTHGSAASRASPGPSPVPARRPATTASNDGQPGTTTRLGSLRSASRRAGGGSRGSAERARERRSLSPDDQRAALGWKRLAMNHVPAVRKHQRRQRHTHPVAGGGRATAWGPGFAHARRAVDGSIRRAAGLSRSGGNKTSSSGSNRRRGGFACVAVHMSSQPMQFCKS